MDAQARSISEAILRSAVSASTSQPYERFRGWIATKGRFCCCAVKVISRQCSCMQRCVRFPSDVSFSAPDFPANAATRRVLVTLQRCKASKGLHERRPPEVACRRRNRLFLSTCLVVSHFVWPACILCYRRPSFRFSHSESRSRMFICQEEKDRLRLDVSECFKPKFWS